VTVALDYVYHRAKRVAKTGREVAFYRRRLGVKCIKMFY